MTESDSNFPTTAGAPRGPVSAAEGIAADRHHVIHGFAQHGQETEPGPIFRRARGIHMETVDGVDWIDASAGQANVNLGYSRDDLAEVAGTALKELCFGTTFYHQRGHAAGATLA